MGNLARATFEKSTMSMWPWSYDKCDGSIDDLPAKQQISACLADPGFGMHPHQGRGAPEIGESGLNCVGEGHSSAHSFAQISSR